MKQELQALGQFAHCNACKTFIGISLRHAVLQTPRMRRGTA